MGGLFGGLFGGLYNIQYKKTYNLTRTEPKQSNNRCCYPGAQNLLWHQRGLATHRRWAPSGCRLIRTTWGREGLGSGIITCIEKVLRVQVVLAVLMMGCLESRSWEVQVVLGVLILDAVDP